MADPAPRKSAYDVVVVGAGLGGLSAAACLAAAGKSVLAVERSDAPGGYASSFRRGEYVFDPAIHVTASGFGGLDFWNLLLGGLGVAGRLELLSPEPFYGVVFPDFRIQVPAGVEEFTEAHADAFPHEADGVRRFVGLVAQVTAETQALATRLSLAELENALEAFPVMFGYRMTPLGAALEEQIGDPRVRAVLAASWPYVGLPPSRVSFIQFGAMLAGLVEKGPLYARGSFQALADTFAAAIREHGGELLLGTAAERILVEGGRAAGVVLAGGREVRAPVVISNADATHTVRELVGVEHFPASFVRRFERMRPSTSAAVLYAATTLDVRESGLAHETFVYRGWDHDEDFERALAGRLGGTWLSLPTLHDPSLAPAGEHLVTFTSLMGYDAAPSWDDAREALTELMVAEVEALLPGFRERITHLEVSTPATLERFTGNRRGAMYGWDNSPDQSQPKRLAHRLPIEGLLLAGHWTEPGSSSFRVMFSGLQAAGSALGLSGGPVELLHVLHGRNS